MAHAVLIRRTTPVVIAALAVLMIALASVGANAASEGIVTKSAKGSFENTVTKLKKRSEERRVGKECRSRW